MAEPAVAALVNELRMTSASDQTELISRRVPDLRDTFGHT